MDRKTDPTLDDDLATLRSHIRTDGLGVVPPVDATLAALTRVESHITRLQDAMRVASENLHVPPDGIGPDGVTAHRYMPGHPMGCPVCEAFETAQSGEEKITRIDMNQLDVSPRIALLSEDSAT